MILIIVYCGIHHATIISLYDLSLSLLFLKLVMRVSVGQEAIWQFALQILIHAAGWP